MRNAGRRAGWAACALVASVLAIPIGGQAVADAPAGPTRILLVGDSITQGSAGDWTWRYRLWQHLTEGEIAFDFVGYRDDLRDEIEHTFGNQDYVDPAFDRDHAARWGMSIAALDRSAATLVADHQPDVLVALLGDNDLTAGTPPAQVADLLGAFVADARSVDPTLDLVLVNDPRPTYQPQATAYNALVADLVADLDTPSSRVVLADAATGYDDTQETYDGAHPNSHGELKIAAAVADALSVLGVGTPADRPLPLASTPVGPRIPPVLAATAGALDAQLSWFRSPGAQTSEVWERDVTAGTPWTELANGVTGTSFAATGLTAGHQVQFQTKPLKGFWTAQPDAWSNVVAVDVLADHLDAPTDVTAAPGGPGQLSVTWAPVPDATSYVVEWHGVGSSTWSSTGPVSGESALVGELEGRRSYVFRVRAARDALVGDYSAEVVARVPASTGDPARVMLLGDSTTMGSTGDWTWRYRLWTHLEASSPGLVELVGPRSDLYDRATRTYGHQDYVDPAFDRDHAGFWGRGVAFPATPTGQLVAQYDVDTLVVTLGANDLEFLHLSPATVADGLRGLVEDARGANPEVDVVLGEVTATWLPGAPELNILLHDVAADLDSSLARVVVAETADGYSRVADTYDDSHPNARGEVKMAAAFADALSEDDVGATYARPLPVPPVGPRIPVVLRGTVRDGKLVLKWTRSPGADSYTVLVQRPSRSKRWRQSAETSRRHVTLRGLAPGERLRFVVLPRKGRDLAGLDVRSNRISVRI